MTKEDLIDDPSMIIQWLTSAAAHKRRSDRGNGGGKDERSVKDTVEDKNADTYVVAHKKGSSISKDEMLDIGNG